MKKYFYFAACVFALAGAPTLGHTADTTTATGGRGSTGVASNHGLTKFNLDFPGGSPQQLVQAIEKATGKPLNAIIPPEDDKVQLPPLKMNNVTVAELFQALYLASKKTEMYSVSPGAYSQETTSYGFMNSGRPTDNSIWIFTVKKPAKPALRPTPPPRHARVVCRFYLLTPYLDRGLKVDDITTAIQTGWKMMGDTSLPKISYHKETKLLIAVGEPDKLDIIDSVLEALRKAPYKMAIDPTTGLPVVPAINPNTGLPVSPDQSKGKH